jgi:hypothetical protein
MERNGYTAEIFVSKTGACSIFHYIVQRTGSLEILHWGQESSMTDAQFAVDEILDSRSEEARHNSSARD